MEILGYFAPTWMLVLSAYLLGMPLIGYPLAKWSLLVWKNPDLYSHWLRLFLFTTQEVNGDVGKYWKSGTDGNWEFETSLPRLFEDLDIHEALKTGDLAQLRKYAGWTMFFWPLRILYTTCGLFLESIISTIKFSGKSLT